MIKTKKEMREKGLSPKGTVPNVFATIITLLLILTPSYLEAFYLPGEETKKKSDASTLNKAQFKTPTLLPEYQQVYEISGKLYRLNEYKVLIPLTAEETAQYNQYKTKEEIKVNKEAEGQGLAQIETEEKTKPFLGEEEAKKEISQEQANGEAVDLANNQEKEIIAENKPQVSAAEKLQGVSTLKELKTKDATVKKLDLLSISGRKSKKRILEENPIKLEGLSGDGRREEEEIQFVPQVKTREIYQGSPSTGNKKEQVNFLNKPTTQTLDRR